MPRISRIFPGFVVAINILRRADEPMVTSGGP
jgi:hypothetical protein